MNPSGTGAAWKADGIRKGLGFEYLVFRPTMLLTNQSPQEAAKTLWARLRDYSWFVSVGVQERLGHPSTLLVYVKRRHWQQDQIALEWCGYHVRVVRSGQPRPG
jgi:hypothetical protein